MEAGTRAIGDDTSELDRAITAARQRGEERITAYVDALEAATTVAGLLRLRERAAELMRVLSSADPDRADALDAVFNRRHEELSQGKLL